MSHLGHVKNAAYRVVDNEVPPGVAPGIVLVQPKYARNVSMALRVASCFGVRQLWFTGDRIKISGKRLPREERMKMYRQVELLNYDKPLEAFPRGTTPVAVEVLEHSESLPYFVHPDNPVYVFGPEDGSIPKGMRAACRSFVTIPSRHCFNLAVAVSLVLYDRMFKESLIDPYPRFRDDFEWPELAEHRGFIDFGSGSWKGDIA